MYNGYARHVLYTLIYSHLNNLASLVLLQLVPEDVTLLILLLRRLFSESPRL